MNKSLEKITKPFIKLYYFCYEIFQALKLILMLSTKAFVILFSIFRITSLFIPLIIISIPFLFLIPFSYFSLFAIAFTLNAFLPNIILDPFTDLTENIVHIIYKTIQKITHPISVICKQGIYLVLLINNLHATFTLFTYIVYFTITVVFFSQLQHFGDDTKEATTKIPKYNPKQSTHFTSVHNSVEATVNRLRKRYPNTPILNHIHLATAIQRFINNAPEDLHKRAACDRFLEKELQNWYSSVCYGTTVPELLSIILFALNDQQYCLCSKEDGAKFLQEALYQIQRGDAINERGEDIKHMPDKKTCLSGMLNKLVEQFVGLHPDFQLIYITKLATLIKLPSIITQVLKDYLQVLPSYQARAIITNILSTKDISDDLYELLLPNICHKVWDEFSQAFKDFDECQTLCQHSNAIEIDEKFIDSIIPWKTFNQKICSMILTL